MPGMFESYEIDPALVESSEDPRIRAIMDQLERRYPGRCSLGTIERGAYAPGVVEREGRIVATATRLGMIFSGNAMPTQKISHTAALLLMRSGSPLFESRIVLPATSFLLARGSGGRLRNRITRADGKPFMYLAGFCERPRAEANAVLIMKPCAGDTRCLSDDEPMVLDEEDVRAWLTDPDAFTALLRKEQPEFRHEKLL